MFCVILKEMKFYFCRIYSFVLLFFAVLFSAGSLSPSDERGWSLGPVTEMSWGTVNEIVYDTSGVPNQNDYLSLLLWDLQNVFTAGVESRWNSGGRYGLEFALSSAVPSQPTGIMEDYDWLFTDRDWSHWSKSDIRLRWGIIFDVLHDFQVFQRDFFSLRLGAGYHLDWWAWRDVLRDSVYSTTNPSGNYPAPFGTYPGEGFRDTEISPSRYGQNSIDYSVAYHALPAVISLHFRWDKPYFSLKGGVGPAMMFGHDYHKFRALHFYDSAIGGPWVSAEITAGMSLHSNFSMEIRGEYMWVGETRGDSTVSYGGASSTVPDVAGFSMSRFSAGVSGVWQL